MIDNFQAVIPDKAKQLMMMLGKSKEEEGILPTVIQNLYIVENGSFKITI